jgi:DNA mismatch repair protein MLH1
MQENVLEWTEVELTSVLELRDELELGENITVTELFREHTYVGCVDDRKALIQHQTKLILVDLKMISEFFFYQIAIDGFANFSRMKLPKISLYEVALMNKDMDEKEARRITDLITKRNGMLLEYFSIEIDDLGNLTSIPIMLKEYVPNLYLLPQFVKNLGQKVNWNSEKECFYTLSKQLARFYAFSKSPDQSNEDYHKCVEHLLFPSLKMHFIGPKQILTNGSLLELAHLPNLYKIFERC